MRSYHVALCPSTPTTYMFNTISVLMHRILVENEEAGEICALYAGWLCEFVLDITCVCVDQRRNSISEHSLLTHVHFTCFLQWNWPQTSKLSDVINFPPFVIVLAYHSWNIFLIIGFQNFSSSSNHSPSTLNQLTMAPYNHDSVCVLKSCSSNAIS